METFLGIKTTLFGSNLKKKAFAGKELSRCSVGVLSVISRSSVGIFREGIREVKETAILTKVLFWWLGVLWSFLGSSLVLRWSLARDGLVRYKGKEY